MNLRCMEAQAHLQESKQEFDALSPRCSLIIIPVCRSLFLKRGELKHRPLQTIVVCKKQVQNAVAALVVVDCVKQEPDSRGNEEKCPCNPLFLIMNNGTGPSFSPCNPPQHSLLWWSINPSHSHPIKPTPPPDTRYYCLLSVQYA